MFARAPVPGRTKTRLIPALGAAGATELHRALVRHALTQAAAAAPTRLELWGTGDDPGDELGQWAREFGAELYWQVGDDLGMRMQRALAAALERTEAALVIGSDCPWLDAVSLQRAQAALARHDAVLGPAEDGGYVLLGVSRADGRLFDDIPWGTDQVLAVTRDRLEALGWNWLELEPRGDIDRPEDLVRLERLGGPWRRLAGAG